MSHPGVVLAPIKLNSLRPGSSILVKCRQLTIIEGGLNLINSLGIPLGRACPAYQLSVNRQTNLKLDSAFSRAAFSGGLNMNNVDRNPLDL